EGAVLTIEPLHRSRLIQELVPDEQRGAERPARVPRGRLDPDVLEGALAENAPVSDAVQGDASRQAQVPHTGHAMNVGGGPHHDLLGHFLDRSRDVHLTLGEGALRFSRWTLERPIELAGGYRDALAI